MPPYQPVAPHVVENVLLGACPEREAEMRQSWESFKPEFYLREDDVEAAISANGNRVSWMHKTFALDWVIATMGMQALTAYSPHILLAQARNVPLSVHDLTEDADVASVESQMDEATYFARLIWQAKQLDELEWPATIPLPGTCPDPSLDPIGKATFDLACLAAATTFFHELRHVQFAAQCDAPPLTVEEERACDVHARSMLLDHVADYCATTGEPYSQVLNKRIMGLATAAFCIAHVEPAGLQAAIVDTHPPVAERFKALVLDADADDDATGWIYTACLLIHVLRRANRLPTTVTFFSAKDLCRQLVDSL
ncbi:phage exclusion protein Lit family protein [Novilysobacter antarcticus]|uniref:phage exclusion protein Lit family protein n=1 Tax=Novilysobacter antarcticus TaxID=2862543 RepID=UPI001C99D2C6|nr:phage exclusion protein Lit family protein [Lysobacter antarcticus]